MKRLVPSRVSAVGLALCACAASALAQGAAKPPCAADTLAGHYVFAASGQALIGGVWSPKAIVESIWFNGDGTLAVMSGAVANLAGNGAVTPIPGGGAGTYALNPDCSGTLSFTPGPSFVILAAPKGDEAWMIQANPDNVFQGSLKLLSR